MKFKSFGRHNIEVSAVGLGCEHLEGKPYEQVYEVIRAAIETNITIMDIFMPQGEVRSNIGKALSGVRGQVMLQGHIGATLGDDGQYLRSREFERADRYVNDFMKRLNTDYIDIGMMHFIDTAEDYRKTEEFGQLDHARKLQQQGKIRFVGASSHDAATAIKMVENDWLDVLMFSINPVFDMLGGENDPDTMIDFEEIKRSGRLNAIDPARKRLYELCEQKGVPITVMKGLGAGRLLNADMTPFSKPLTVAQCVAYSLDRPGVSSVLVGCTTAEQVRHAVASLNVSPEERDYGFIWEKSDRFEGKCMYCNHCLPCPSDIDIAAVTKYLDLALASDTQMPKEHYDALPVNATACIECGDCMTRCPFGVDVIANMQKAKEIF